MTREDAEVWVGRTIWQVHGDGTPVPYEIIGFAKQPGAPAKSLHLFDLHILQDESLPRWDATAPAFQTRELALTFTLTQGDRDRLQTIEREAFARRGFGRDWSPRPEPIPLDLFTFAGRIATPPSGYPVAEERTRSLQPSSIDIDDESALTHQELTRMTAPLAAPFADPAQLLLFP